MNMKSIPIEKKIMSYIQSLPYKSRQQVLSFVKALKMSQPNGVPGSDLLKFAGTIKKTDLAVMSQAIKDSCERIDKDEW